MQSAVECIHCLSSIELLLANNQSKIEKLHPYGTMQWKLAILILQAYGIWPSLY